MKKLIVISLLSIYALATMGFTLKEFYCCGKLKTVSLAIEAFNAEKCSKGNNQSDGCCQNKFQYFKVKDTHVLDAKTILQSAFTSILNTDYLAWQHVNFSFNQEITNYQSNAPPIHNGVPVYLSKCVFII